MSYLVQGSCDQQGWSPQELFVNPPGVPVLNKPEAADFQSERRDHKVPMTANGFRSFLKVLSVSKATVAAT